jgi:rhodanese-related sulfurtransferase
MKQHHPGFLRVTDAARARIREVHLEELDALRGANPAWTLVDVREDAEWAAGRIPGAVHLGRGVLERDIEARFPDPATPLVLYCGGGYRSALAAASLLDMGYENVVSLVGGVRAWQEAARPWDDAPAAS